MFQDPSLIAKILQALNLTAQAVGMVLKEIRLLLVIPVQVWHLQQAYMRI